MKSGPPTAAWWRSNQHTADAAIAHFAEGDFDRVGVMGVGLKPIRSGDAPPPDHFRATLLLINQRRTLHQF